MRLALLFNTLLRAARAARTTINREYHALICTRLGAVAQDTLRALLTRVPQGQQSLWDRLKNEPKRPTAQHTRDFLDHLTRLRGLAIAADVCDGIPDVKVKQFAAEARSLDVASMHVCLLAEHCCLIPGQQLRIFDRPVMMNLPPATVTLLKDSACADGQCDFFAAQP